MTDTAPCHPGHEGFVDASELHRAVAARDHWASLQPHLGEPGADASVAAAFAEHQHHLHRAIRESMGQDVADMKHVRKLQHWVRRYDGPDHHDAQNALDSLGPDAELRADITEQRCRVIGAGVALATSTDDSMLELSAGGTALHPTTGMRVMHRTLATPGVRSQLGLHGAVRGRLPRADGHGRGYPDRASEAPEDAHRDAKEKPVTRRNRRRR